MLTSEEKRAEKRKKLKERERDKLKQRKEQEKEWEKARVAHKKVIELKIKEVGTGLRIATEEDLKIDTEVWALDGFFNHGHNKINIPKGTSGKIKRMGPNYQWPNHPILYWIDWSGLEGAHYFKDESMLVRDLENADN